MATRDSNDQPFLAAVVLSVYVDCVLVSNHGNV